MMSLNNNKIKSLYLSGKNLTQLSEIFKCSRWAIKSRLKQMNVAIRPNAGKNNRFYMGGRRTHRAATNAAIRAINKGLVVRPNVCESCGKSPNKTKDGRATLHAHHDNYNKYLDVRFLCRKCHLNWHNNNEAIAYKGT